MIMETGESVVIGRAEIDTRAPFRSVKEAVMLFGEKVLAGEVYANKLKEMRVAAIENGHGTSRLSTVTAELEETRQSLTKAREESMFMANCLTSLKDELEKTKRELQQFKLKESEKQPLDAEMEDIKFIENPTKIEVEKQTVDQVTEFQRKRYVTFANPPLARILTPEDGELLERLPSMKKKKKPLIPLIGGIFSKKKEHLEGASPKAR
ncbi:WEB family protein At1g75720-like [Tasmannia lanceolata]|uniref:WEB family protein At1g75720-like n=1 Tax=Tasmannia lanceolata TaxID=3420 RepID=UPI004063AE06